MSLIAEKELEHLGQSAGCADHDHDLVHELSRRLDNLWRYDQYIANAEWRLRIVEFWEELKEQEVANVRRLKELIAEEVRGGCF